jgi:hypothetical protein
MSSDRFVTYLLRTDLVGIGTCPVAADNLNLRMLPQPGGDRGRRTIREKVQDSMLL